jgi:hypothetical protein
VATTHSVVSSHPYRSVIRAALKPLTEAALVFGVLEYKAAATATCSYEHRADIQAWVVMLRAPSQPLVCELQLRRTLIRDEDFLNML